MIALATGVVQAVPDEGRIRVTADSGGDELILSLSVHQATWLALGLTEAINALLRIPEGSVVPFLRTKGCKS